MCVCTCACVRVCDACSTYVCVCLRGCVCACEWMGVCTCVCMHVHACVRVCMSHNIKTVHLFVTFRRQRQVESVENVVDLLALQFDLDPLSKETVTRLGNRHTGGHFFVWSRSFGSHRTYHLTLCNKC